MLNSNVAGGEMNTNKAPERKGAGATFADAAPAPTGSVYEAEVPDTLDLAEPAAKNRLRSQGAGVRSQWERAFVGERECRLVRPARFGCGRLRVGGARRAAPFRVGGGGPVRAWTAAWGPGSCVATRPAAERSSLPRQKSSPRIG